MGFLLRGWDEKTVDGMATHKLAGKEKVKVMLIVLRYMKGPLSIDFLVEGAIGSNFIENNIIKTFWNGEEIGKKYKKLRLNL